MTDILKNFLQERKAENIGICARSEVVKEVDGAVSCQVFQIGLGIFPGSDEYPEISLREAKERKIKIILLAEQLIARKDEFYQLITYCDETGAEILDLNGRTVDQAYRNSLENEKRECSKEELLNLIMNHECISFDIFDTLLQRNTLYPSDVFELAGRRAEIENIKIDHYKEKRILAQEKYGLTNPDLHQIYEQFKEICGLDAEQADQCMNIEIKIEQELLEVREEMLEIFRKCLELNKQVFLITDMYIPKEVLISILKAKGIEGYKEIYLSCDRKMLKLQGLFEIYKEEQQGCSYLHIGDHRIHDGICAELASIDYYLIPGCMKMGKEAGFSAAIEKAESLEEHIVCGMVIAKAFQSPFRSAWRRGCVEIFSNYEYVYVFCAALLCKFTIWLYEMVKKSGYDDILFASRDGFLLQKLYLLIRKKKGDGEIPEGKYFYTSRKAAVMTGINNEAMINMIVDISFGLNPEFIMSEYFGLKKEQILAFGDGTYEKKIHPFVWKHVDKIFARSEEAKQNYYKYMGNLGLQIGKKYAFVDFVSSGTSQKSLSRISPFKLEGLYVGWNSPEDRHSCNVEAMFTDMKSYFLNHYKVMETFVTAQEPSVSHIDEDGSPVFGKQLRTCEEQEYIGEAQEACIDFFSKFLSLMVPGQCRLTNEFVDCLFSVRQRAGIFYDTPLQDLTLIDDWMQVRNKVD